ncbi:hypothetical protein ACLB2K_063259 [Fragaria x ananassa]
MLVLQQLTQETAPSFDLIGTGCHIFSFQCCIHLLKMSLAAVAKQRPVHYGTVVSSVYCLDITLKCAVHPQDDIRTRGVRLVANKLYPLGEELMEWHTYARQSTRKCTQISREKRFHNLILNTTSTPREQFSFTSPQGIHGRCLLLVSLVIVSNKLQTFTSGWNLEAEKHHKPLVQPFI